MTTTRHAFAASFGQRSLWFLDQFEPGRSTYNVPIATRLKGSLDLGRLERSLRAVVARHESLRTRFELHDGELLQVVESDVDVSVGLRDLTESAPDNRDDRAREILTDEAEQPFDLSHAPLIRALMVRLRPDEHILLLTLHHTVCDGWSLGVLLRELGIGYNALANDGPSPLAPLDIQYGDYAVWQLESLTAAESERQLSYWRQALNGVPTLELPADRPRPPVLSSRGAELPISIPREVTDALASLARKERATLFMILLAAFQTLLMRHTSQRDVAVGTAAAGRNRVEVEPLIGYFVNTLVMRTTVTGDLTFRELLNRVRAVTLGAYSHQDIPFEKLVEALRPERATSHTPLCQTMLVLQNMAPQVLAIDGVTASPFEVSRSTAKFELTLSLTERPDGLEGMVAYSTDLFEPATVSRMAGHFERLLQSVCANPDRRLSELPMLSDDEHQQLAIDLNDTKAEYPALCLHQLFEAQVERSPHATAVISHDGSLTYSELNGRANQLAHVLRRSGVGPDAVAGVCLERSLNLVVALLGILKAGGAYLPLDPSYPQARLTGMLEDAAATVVVTESGLVDRLPPRTGVLCLDQDAHLHRSERREDPESKATPESLAYVLFTSGSTGRPKGVMLPHRAVCNYLHWMQSAFPLGADDRVLQRTPASFDLSVWEFFLPLIAGAAVVMAPPAAAFEPARIVEVILRHGVTVAQFVPAVLELMLDEPGVSRCTSLRRVFSGGAALTPALRNRFFERFERASVHNLYGPTETCINSVAWTCRREDHTARVPIGRPIANTQVFVVGPSFELLPLGAVGELLIGGAGLARGYINRPDLTTDRFVAHPLATSPDARVYRTGDRVRYLPDGNLEFLGRADDQVKVRGVRIELEEVGAALGRHVAIQQSVVVAHNDAAGHPELVAYYVARAPHPSDEELRRFMRETLPEGMVPSWFVRLEGLPLAPNGKLDRRALPAPTRSRSPAAPFAAPRTGLERAIARIWSARLGIEAIGIHDNFFDLGGHSLLAARIVTEIRGACDADVPLRALFESPTIAGLVARLASREPGEDDGLVALQPHGTKTPFFCVHGVGGEVQSYAELARRMDPERPLFGLRAPPWVDGDPPITVEALAARHIENMRRAVPDGPYLIGGYSAGSTIAYEMAQQLVACGTQVRLVVAIDSSLPNTGLVRRGARTWLRAAKNICWWIVDDLMETDRRELVGRMRSKVALLASRIATRPGFGWVRPARPADVRDVLGIPWAPDDWAPFLQQLHLAHRAYVPRPYPGKVAVLRARTRPLFRLSEWDLGWSRMAKGGVDVRTVRGSHGNILHEPHVRDLAEALRQALDQAERTAKEDGFYRKGSSFGGRGPCRTVVESSTA